MLPDQAYHAKKPEAESIRGVKHGVNSFYHGLVISLSRQFDYLHLRNNSRLRSGIFLPVQ